MAKEPRGTVVTCNGKQYRVDGAAVYVQRRRGDRLWWQRLPPRGPTAMAAKQQLKGQQDGNV